MKTAKLIISIVSMVSFLLIMLQSCAVGVLGVLDASTQDKSGIAGFFLAFIMLTAGIIGIATRDSKGGSIIAGAFYLIGALIGAASLGTYGDLAVWTVVSLMFSATFMISGAFMKSSRT